MKPKSTKKAQDDKLKLDSVPKSLDELFEGYEDKIKRCYIFSFFVDSFDFWISKIESSLVAPHV